EGLRRALRGGERGARDAARTDRALRLPALAAARLFEGGPRLVGGVGARRRLQERRHRLLQARGRSEGTRVRALVRAPIRPGCYCVCATEAGAEAGFGERIATKAMTARIAPASPPTRPARSSARLP